MSLPGSLVAEECTAFENACNDYLHEIKTGETFSDDEQLSPTVDWIDAVCRYNVPHGKKLRGLLVPLTVRSLINSPTEVKMEEAYVLGWCVEILQAACLIADDIMDRGEMRRGRPCWYLVDKLGPDAFNDTLVLEHNVYQLIREHFKETSYYSDLVDLFLQVTRKTVLGQCLDTQTGRKQQFEECTRERYEAIVKYKTSYYTFYLPIALAMKIAHVRDGKLEKKLEDITVSIGYMFQVLNDYLDCFGCEAEMGKVGTDIENGKCTWLFVRAKQLCSQEQLEVLYENYGKDGEIEVAKVKAVYEGLNMPKEFAQFMKQMKEDTTMMIQKLENDGVKILMSQLLSMHGLY